MLIPFHFVEDRADTYAVKWMCQVLEINRSSFYEWREGRQGRDVRTAAGAALIQRLNAWAAPGL